ncbi:MAG: flavin oxidoreductase [Nocardioides sp.]|nr:flavin oxidoreductase [Nocardioides sp.]
MTTSTTDAFKQGFRRHPAGVALALGAGADGPVGLTVSSLASVSADPPALSFSVVRGGATAEQLVGSDVVDLVLLADHHREVAAAFARSGAERFTAEQGWQHGDGPLPVLADAPARFRGRPARVVPVGGSWLVVVEVTDVDLGPASEALVYADRDYHGLQPLGAAVSRPRAC